MKIAPSNFQTAVRLWSLAVLFSTTHAWAADATNHWNVRVVGAMVVAPEGGKDTRAFCWKPGVTVSAILSPAADKIISIDQSESKIDSFTDDKGTDLMAAPASEDPFNKPGLSTPSSSSEGGAAAMIVDLKASGQPAKGATVLNISGKVTAQTAGQSKQFTLENVEIKTNSQFNLGDLPMTISSVGRGSNPFMKQDEFSVTFSSPKNLESISRLEFFDSEGTKIEARKSSWGGGFGSYMVEYVFKKSVARARIVATCWQDLKVEEVPFSVKAGVGL